MMELLGITPRLTGRAVRALRRLGFRIMMECPETLDSP